MTYALICDACNEAIDLSRPLVQFTVTHLLMSGPLDPGLPPPPSPETQAYHLHTNCAGPLVAQLHRPPAAPPEQG